MNIKHTIWNEKYRPDTLENYLCNDEVKTKVTEFIENQDIPMLGLFGKPGSGKTTLAKILYQNIECDHLYLNAVDERSIDIIRNKVGGFASTATFAPRKIIVLDESTHLLESAQVLLLNMIETYSLNTRFILTGNYPERLIEPLRSRLTEFKLDPPTKGQVAQHLVNILDSEKAEYDKSDIVKIINKFYPDVRKTINNCQRYSVNGFLTLNSELDNNVDYKDQIITLLSKPNKKTWVEIRQLIANEDVSDFDDIYRYIFDNINKFPGQEGEITFNIGEYLYRSTSILDKEINFMTFIQSILK